MKGGLLGRLERASSFKLGVVLLTIALVVALSLFQKARISTTLHRGEAVQADFKRDYRMRPYVTKVKIAGVPVGIVTGVHHDPSGVTRVTMKVDDGTSTKLRLSPMAAIRPTTLLGGNYYVDLRPGGDPGTLHSVIPDSRTTIPVELDRVLETLNPAARVGVQRTVRDLNSTLTPKGQTSVRQVLKDAPGTLRPAGAVLEALRGTNPNTDLSKIVSNLDNIGRVLTAKQGQLAAVIDGLDRTSAILDDQKYAISSSIKLMPQALSNARTGLAALSVSLDHLKATSKSAEPVATRLDHLLARLQPALVEARPVVHDLRPALVDLRPLVQSLVPSARVGTKVLHDVDGAPLERVNGPIIHTLLSPWTGTGQYAGSGSTTTPFYKELGTMIAGMDNASKMTDRNGSTIHFQPGFGVGSVSDLPISLEQLFKMLLYPGGPK